MVWSVFSIGEGEWRGKRGLSSERQRRLLEGGLEIFVNLLLEFFFFFFWGGGGEWGLKLFQSPLRLRCPCMRIPRLNLPPMLISFGKFYSKHEISTTYFDVQVTHTIIFQNKQRLSLVPLLVPSGVKRYNFLSHFFGLLFIPVILTPRHILPPLRLCSYLNVLLLSTRSATVSSNKKSLLVELVHPSYFCEHN